MRQQINLFIEDREVEFSQPPQILYNYKEKELRNPTIVKNSFSKSIEIEGTPTNNDIFGHIWNLERSQYYGAGGGVTFNPSRRADFKLYVNSELYERGYCKLDNIVKTGNDVKYQISLFGGIGSFLYGLQNRDGDTEAKLSLADLDYVDDSYGSLDLDFNITKETVQEAWQQLDRKIDDKYKWDVINFAVTAEGVPDDFSADRVLFNSNGNFNLFPVSSGDYRTILNGDTAATGYCMLESKKPLTMDTSFDLRSYLLRPVLSIEAFFRAIRMPQNNGGYDIQLDNHFFYYNNPYYHKAWLTLPRLRELNIERGTSTTVQASMSKSGSSIYNLSFTKPTNAENVSVIFRVTATPTGTTTATELWSATYCKTNLQYHNWDEYVKTFQSTGGLVVRLEALNASNQVVGKGDPILLCSGTHNLENELAELYTKTNGGNVQRVYGHFVKKNGTFVFCDANGNTLNVTTKLNGGADYTKLRLVVTNPYAEYTTLTRGWPRDWSSHYANPDRIKDGQTMPFYTTVDSTWTGEHTESEVKAHNRVNGNWGLSLVEVRPETLDYNDFFSGTRITKDKLLKTDYTPASVLLDYCKLFGLYFYMDPTEVSDDPDIYPQGVIHILDRDSFYNEQVVNINELIDRSKPININPRTAESKWYSFSYQDAEGDAEEKYKNNYGYAYGRQLVNTNSNFSAEVTELYDGSIFKNGVMVREKSDYLTFGDICAGYQYDGFVYHLFRKNGDEYDANDMNYTPKKNVGKAINNLGLDYYDCMPKLQVHNADNEGGDGSGILLFFNSFVNTVSEDNQVVYYNLTDDLPDMGRLNDGQPCWINTIISTDALGNTIAIRRSSIPFFSRDIYDNGEEGNIVHSWNFGHPQDTFVPKTFSTDFDCIYDKCWRDYMRDLYDVDTKVVKASVRLNGKPNPSWLRRYYWWDNALWVINSITDWNVSSFDTTEVEFIKVQDTNNYKLTRIDYTGRLQILIDSGVPVPHTGGTVQGRVVQQSTTDHWAFDDIIVATYANGTTEYLTVGYDITLTPTTGTGVSTNFTLTVPANASALSRTFTIGAEDSDDTTVYGYVEQEGDNSPYLDFAPESKNVEVGTNAQTVVLYFVAQNIRPNSVTASSNSPEWVSVVSVDEATSAITLSVSASTMGGLRTALITINGIGVNGAVVNNQTQFKQQGSDIDVYPYSISINYNETGTGRVQIITSSNWTATINDSNGE